MRAAATGILVAVSLAAAPASADLPPIHDPHLRIVPGTTAKHGPGPHLWRYAIEVEKGIAIDHDAFAAQVDAILFDRRSWAGPRSHIRLQRVDHRPFDFRITLARPATVDRLCAPLHTAGRVSCGGVRGRTVINWRRWLRSSPAWSTRTGYRTYLVNHEVGHSLGHGHAFCPGRGKRAFVMQQQTGSARPCRHGWWPKRSEVEATRGPKRAATRAP